MNILLHMLLKLAFTVPAFAANIFDIRSHGAKGDDLVRPEVGVLSIAFDITRDGQHHGELFDAIIEVE